jgi:hypothetical protein
MRKRNAGLIRFAHERGMQRSGKVDWYSVAELLAKKFAPELLESLKRGGRPREADNWAWLVDDVIAVMDQRACSEREACEALASGGHPHRVMIDGRYPVRLASNKRWKGMKVPTLYRRYREQKRIRQKRTAPP